MRASISLLLVALILGVASLANADHYLLEDVSQFDDDVRERYQAAGIPGTSELRAAGVSPAARAELASRVGLPGGVVNAHVLLADFLELPSVGPVIAELFIAAGVSGLQDLATRDPDALAEHLAEVNTRTRIAPITPERTSLMAWIEAASAVDTVVDW